uniref:TMC domain-containing protein n=1 Tax=Angiostrongylus cantonensis TaxID=6313 RepID=A0A0K0D3P0_ANGCA
MFLPLEIIFKYFAKFCKSTIDKFFLKIMTIFNIFTSSESDAFLDKSDKKDEADEDGKPLTRQALLERIRQKKEVIGKLRCQPWSMSRKKRTLKLAQKYLEQHESRVSRTHLYMEEFRKRIRLMKRSFSNFKTYLIPWEGKIKRIESHFGSVVSSYFTFLRWIVFVNVIMTVIIVALVVLPETLADAAADETRRNRTDSRKRIPPNERVHADEIAVVWHYDGYLRYSPLFYGYYSDDDFLGQKYPLPLAYFLVTIFIFAYSFFAILRKMAANARMSKLSGSKAEQYIFNWRVFTGWDYTIGNQETASNTVMAIVIKLRESIADCRVSEESKFRCLQFTSRVIANIIICAMLAFSIYCISFAVQKSQTAVEQEGNLFTKNQVPSVVATITHVFPMIFDLIGRLENYHP